MATITWKVDKLECLKAFNEKTDIVTRVYYSISADQDNFNSIYKSSRDLDFDPNSISGFVEYENLTEDIVLGWLFSSLGEEQKVELEQVVTDSLNVQIQNQKVERPLPWVDDLIEVEMPPDPANVEPEADISITSPGPIFPELVVEEPQTGVSDQ